MSVREITRRADVNVAAVHYHFGGKEGVLRAITDRVVLPLNDRRLELLDRARRRGDPVPVETLLDAFIRPDVETLLDLQAEGTTLARFIGRTYSDPSEWIQAMALDQFAPTRASFVPAFIATLPHLDAEELAWRITRVVAVVVQLFATWPEGGMSPEQGEVVIRRLVAFLAPGMAAAAIPLEEPR